MSPNQTRVPAELDRVRGAWLGRVSGCMLGKAVERFSMAEGPHGLRDYLGRVGALPLRDYVPFEEGPNPPLVSPCCLGCLTRAESDDDINYSVLALLLLEAHGADFGTEDVGRMWLRLLPGAATWTAERSAYLKLLEGASVEYILGADDPGFDVSTCSDNPFSDWIGAQIRADVYGWILPGAPHLAADLARRDAELSHRGEGVHAAAFVAGLGAAIPVASTLDDAVGIALDVIPRNSAAAAAVAFARSLAGRPDGPRQIQHQYRDLTAVHAVNNLAIVVWALLTGADDYSVAVGEAVAAGWDTDCNGATVGGLWGLTGRPIPPHWTDPWAGRVMVSLAGMAELSIFDLVDRTLAVANRLRTSDGEVPLYLEPL